VFTKHSDSKGEQLNEAKEQEKTHKKAKRSKKSAGKPQRK